MTTLNKRANNERNCDKYKFTHRTASTASTRLRRASSQCRRIIRLFLENIHTRGCKISGGTRTDRARPINTTQIVCLLFTAGRVAITHARSRFPGQEKYGRARNDYLRSRVLINAPAIDRHLTRRHLSAGGWNLSSDERELRFTRDRRSRIISAMSAALPIARRTD